eukprot:g38879.t1
MAIQWRRLRVPATELRLDVTLLNGQAFGWKKQTEFEGQNEKDEDKAVYTGVLGSRVFSLREEPNDVSFALRFPSCVREQDAHLTEAESALRDYLRLSPGPGAEASSTEQPAASGFCLHKQVDCWTKADPHFAARAPHLPGMRLLRQAPIECLFSFICSSNNHISRITGMVDSLRRRYGQQLCTLPDGSTFFAFPSAAELVQADEAELRALGFGYRAKFIVQSAQRLQELGGEDWLLKLRAETDPIAVREALMGFHGVGRKVADCVALFSLDQLSVIPVDTHVWQIALRHYAQRITGGLTNEKGQQKSLTDKLYQQVGDVFRDIFGDRAGWAHSIMFTADLPAFQDRLPEHLRTAPARKASPAKRKKKTPDENAAQSPSQSSKKRNKISSELRGTKARRISPLPSKKQRRESVEDSNRTPEKKLSAALDTVSQAFITVEVVMGPQEKRAKKIPRKKKGHATKAEEPREPAVSSMETKHVSRRT